MIATIIFAPMAAMLVQAAISRSREFLADAGGAKIAGSPHGLINALRKLEMGSKQIPLDANPATAHMFIIKPFSAGGLLEHVQHASADRAAHSGADESDGNSPVVARRFNRIDLPDSPGGSFSPGVFLSSSSRFDTRYFFCSIFTIPRTSFAYASGAYAPRYSR